MCRKLSSESGVSLLEAAIGLPIALVFVLFMIWVGVYLNAKTALTSGMGRALRLAATRSDPNFSGGHSIQVLDEWLDGVAVSDPEKLKRLLSNGTDWDFAQAYYNQITIREIATSGEQIGDLSKKYAYALVYLNEALRQSVGNSVRFPCDPKDEDLPGSYSERQHGSGCLGCKFLDPEPNNADYTLSCKFHAGADLLNPVSNLLGMLTGHYDIARPIISRELSFTVRSS